MPNLMKGSIRAQLSYSVVINAISIAVNFTVQILLVRFFGVTGFGKFAYWRNNVQLGSQLSLFGFHTASIRFLPQLLERGNRASLRKFLKTSYGIVTGLACICALIILFILPSQFTDTSLQQLLPTIAACLALPLTIVMCSQLRLIGSLHQAIFMDRLGYQGLFLISILGMIFLSAQREALSLAQLFASALCFTFIIISFLLWRALRAHDQKLDIEDSIAQAPKWAQALPNFFFLAIGNVINLRIGIFVVGAMLGAKSTGQFAFMQALAGIVTFPLFSFNQIVGPRISVLNTQGDFSSIGPLVRKVQLLSLTMGISLAAVMFLCQPLIFWVTNKPDVIVPAVFIILLSATVINAGFGPVGTALAMIGKEKYAALYTNMAAALKVPLLVFLTWKFGLIGAAIGELIAVLVWNLAMQLKLLSSLKMSSASMID